MKPGTIVFEGTTKKGIDVVLRYPLLSDAQAMMQYINRLSKERTYILMQGAQMTLKQEQAFVKTQIEMIKKKRAVMLLAFSGKKLVGISGITMEEHAREHVGLFGISVAQEFRGSGVGRLLMEQVITHAKKQIRSLQLIKLEVYENNPVAQKLYQSLGFKKYGILPRSVKHRGKYVDEVLMFKNISR